MHPAGFLMQSVSEPVGSQFRDVPMSYQKKGQRLSVWARGFAGALALAAVSVTSVPGEAFAKGPSRCANKTEASALHMRSLQNHLMVAALSCDKRNEYDAFVTRFNKTLSNSGKTMKQYFQGAWGKSSGSQLDNYVTYIANRVSVQSLDNRVSFCNAANDMIQHVMKLDDAGLASYSATLPKENTEAPQVCL